MPSFPLTTEPWIQVWDLDAGTGRDVGLTEAFARAHRLCLPTTTAEDVPILRFLIGLYDAACGPTTTAEWDSAWKAHTLDTEAIAAYLDRWADSLDLFHPQRPAFQAASLTEYHRGPEALHPGSLGGDAGAWFNHELLTGVRPWNPGHAARLLLHLLAYDPAGIKRAAPGDPAARSNKIYGAQVGPQAAVTHAHLALPGHVLKDLLLLNLPPQSRVPGDSPVWERDTPPAPMRSRTAAGRLDLITWPTRRIRLHATADGLVDAVAHYEGDRLPDGWDTVHTLDPMTAWYTSRKGTPAPFDILDIEQSPCVWRPAILLDSPEQWAALQHVIAAAERGVLAPDRPVRAVMRTVVHSNRHRATISNIAVESMPLGTAGQLASAEARTTLATMARYADVIASNLRTHAIQISGLPAARIEHRTLLNNLDRSWDEALELSVSNLDQARTLWRQAVTDAADDAIQTLPLNPLRKAQIQAAYLTSTEASERRRTKTKPAAPATPAPAKTRGGGPRAERYAVFGGQYTLSELSRHADCVVSYKTLRDRVAEGWTVEDAATTPGRRGRQRETDTP
ncbi:type I-E CRISPR-associated protein Cse1/CasA [Streptomyces sp. NPDC001089]